MSKFTDFLNLFKWEPDIDGEEEFNIDKALNENWDKIDTKLKTYTIDTDEKINNFKTDINTEIGEIKDIVDGGVGDLSVTYKNSTITAPTIQGFGKIHKLYGKTEETGEGEKSPSNPYEISCVADSGQVEITSTDGTNTSNKVINCKTLCCLEDSEGNIVAQDYIDFDRQKIHRECGYINSYNSENITANYISSTGSLTAGATIVYQLSETIEEDIDITNSIVQYQNETTISNSDNAEMEIELTNNKAISSINKNIAELQEKDKEFIKKENILLKECKLLGTANNTDTTITLSDDKLSNYKFIAVSSGYFSNKSTTLIPVILFKILDGFNVCRQYVKTYNGYGWTSVQCINDTSFKIYGAVKEMANGSVGTDTITQVYGIK